MPRYLALLVQPSVNPSICLKQMVLRNAFIEPELIEKTGLLAPLPCQRRLQGRDPRNHRNHRSAKFSSLSTASVRSGNTGTSRAEYGAIISAQAIRGPDVRNRWLILAVLFLARTTMGFQFQSVATLSYSIVAQFNVTYTQLGLLISCYLLPGIVVAYPGGTLGKRFGDKQIAILGLTLMVVGGLVDGTSVNYATFFGGRLIAGIGAVLLNVLLLKMATDWFLGREIGTALALLVSSWPVGIGIALIVLPWIAITFSVPSAFLSTAIAAAVVLVLVGAIYRPPEKAMPECGSSFRLLWREKGLVSLAGAVWALFNVGCIIVLSFTPSLLSAQGISARGAGIATSFASWTLISTMVLGGILLDRIGFATALMTTSFAVLGLSMMLLPSASSFALIAFIGAVAGLPCGAMLVLPTEVLRPQSRAPGMGVFYTWYYVGMTLLTPAAGLARDLSGNPGAPLIFAGSLEIAAIAVLGIFRMLQHRWTPELALNAEK
jgi:predicted MFS family arabinose efflux permease